MKTALCFAALAASLVVAPVAMAQTYPNNAVGEPTPAETGSGRSDIPAVRSLPGADRPAMRDDASRPNRAIDRRAANQGAMNDDSMHQGTMHKGTMHKRAMSGSTGGAAMDRDATGSSNRSSMRGSSMDRSDITARRGRGQNDLELSQTTLLNQFSAAGYTVVRDFRKNGDRYVAQAQDRDGRWASVELDPRSGTISPR